jgi:hypothetical protein
MHLLAGTLGNTTGREHRTLLVPSVLCDDRAAVHGDTSEAAMAHHATPWG